MDSIEVQSTSSDSATCGPIELRVSEQVRLVFVPEMVNNPNDPEACLRGRFIYQRKSRDEEWADVRGESLAKLKKGEGFQLELHAGELLKLRKELNQLHQLYRSEGIPSGSARFVRLERKLAALLDLTEEDFLQFLSAHPDDSYQALSRALRWLATSTTSELLTDSSQLAELNGLIGLASLRSASRLWQENKDNGDEEFWQSEFQSRAHVLSQLFSYPIVIVRGKAYVGGKEYNNTHGSIVDFLCRTESTGAALLVEIKTPIAKLLGTEYRRDVFPPSNELSGAVAQVQHYRQNYEAEADRLLRADKSGMLPIAPKCMVLIGNASTELVSDPQRACFERYRHGLGGVEVVTYDELYSRTRQLVDLLERGPS